MLTLNMLEKLLSHFIIFLLFYLPVDSQAEDDDSCEGGDGNFQINKGVAALVGEFPYSVALLYDDYVTRCSGAILTKYHVLTAAHCPINPEGIEIHDLMTGDVVKPDCEEANLLTLQLRSFSKYYRHPKYFVKKPKKVWFVQNAQYDIAILVVDRAFKFTYAVKPIKIADKPLPLDSSCVLAGWGRLHWSNPNSTHNLMFKYDTIRNKTMCNSGRYDILCGGPRFGCPGDCGSSLVCEDGRTHGVFNNAIKIKKIYYMLYADVYWHREWILSIIDGDRRRNKTRILQPSKSVQTTTPWVSFILVSMSLILLEIINQIFFQ